MSSFEKNFAKAMAAASPKDKSSFKLAFIRIETIKGTVLHAFSVDVRDRVMPQILKALRSGHTVVWEDGTREWWELRQRVDTTKSGSSQYEWDKAGQKVRADLVKVRRSRDGRLEEKKAGTRFVDLD